MAKSVQKIAEEVTDRLEDGDTEELLERLTAARAKREQEFTIALQELAKKYRVQVIPVVTITPGNVEAGLQVRAE